MLEGAESPDAQGGAAEQASQEYEEYLNEEAAYRPPEQVVEENFL